MHHVAQGQLFFPAKRCGICIGASGSSASRLFLAAGFIVRFVVTSFESILKVFTGCSMK